MAENNEKEALELEKALKRLKASYDMYEKTKKETVKRMKETLLPDGTRRYTDEDIDKNVSLIDAAEADTVAQYVALGGKEEDLKKKTSHKKATVSHADEEKTMFEMIKGMEDEKKEVLKKEVGATATKLEQEYIPTRGAYTDDATFDVIPLPSKGEGYKDKISKVSVAYLTAYDENMIVSPNLYRDNLILDYLLEYKLLSKEIDPLDLLEGDRDAIILFLRASGYGNEYPITATDDATGKEFETVVDLSKLKYKEFKLKGDSNGWFPFTLPFSKKEVKFRFPTHRDTVLLEKMQAAEENKTKKDAISNYVKTLDTFIESDKEVSAEEKAKIRQAIRKIESWGDSIDEEDAQKFNHALTNRLNLLVMAVDGITDRGYIHEFIKKMSVRDSSALRKYMTLNEPGIDYTITVERPESLGGGSFETFLQLDKFLFLNIAE